MKGKILKVCMLIPSYFPLVGGSEAHLEGMVGKLDRSKVAPFILTRRLKDTPPREKQGQTPIVRTPSPFSPSMFFFSSLWYLIKNRKSFDVLHVHSFDSPALAGAIIKKLFPGKRVILKVPRFGPGSALSRMMSGFIGKRRLGFVLKNVDAIIPLNGDARSALTELGFSDEKMAKIPNGVDTDRFRPPTQTEKDNIRKALNIESDAFVGIFVGRLIERKNVMGILRVWKRVVEKHPESVFLVTGNGPEEENLRRFADYFLPWGSVMFLGVVSRDRVSEILRAADVYVSFSESEGMSNSMLEALSSGLPLIALKGPGINQLIVNGRNGYLIDPAKTDDAVRKLVILARDRERCGRMSVAARSSVLDNYSFDKVARMMERLYLGEEASGSYGRRGSEPQPADEPKAVEPEKDEMEFSATSIRPAPNPGVAETQLKSLKISSPIPEIRGRMQ